MTPLASDSNPSLKHAGEGAHEESNPSAAKGSVFSVGYGFSFAHGSRAGFGFTFKHLILSLAPLNGHVTIPIFARRQRPAFNTSGRNGDVTLEHVPGVEEYKDFIISAIKI